MNVHSTRLGVKLRGEYSSNMHQAFRWVNMEKVRLLVNDDLVNNIYNIRHGF